MEKFNAIKILEEEQYVEDLFNINLGKEQYMKDVYNYVETYIRPLLEKNLSKANIPTPQYFIEEMRDEVLTDDSLSKMSEADRNIKLSQAVKNYLDTLINGARKEYNISSRSRLRQEHISRPQL